MDLGSEEGDGEMTQISPDRLPQLKQVLEQHGFSDPGVLQLIKRGQVFGLVQRIDQALEMHVRAFKDGTLESEIEISRNYLEHLGQNSCRSAQTELETLLTMAEIPFTPSKATISPQRLIIPKKLTNWRKLIAMSVLTGFAPIALILIANHPLIRKKPYGSLEHNRI